MTRIQTKPTQRAGPPTGAPGAYISPHDVYDMTAETRAMGDFGKVFAGLALDRLIKIHDQTVQSEFISGKAAWQSRHNELFAAIDRGQDLEGKPIAPENIENYYNTEREKWQTEIFANTKTRQAQGALQTLITASDPAAQKVLQETIVAKTEDKLRLKLYESLDEFIAAGNFAGASAAMEEAIIAGYAEDEEPYIQKLINMAPELADAAIDGAKNIDPGRKNQLRSQTKSAIAGKQRQAEVEFKAAQEKTYATMLADIWDNKLTKPQVITDAMRPDAQGRQLISTTAGKYMRDALLSPSPTQSTNEALIAVRRAIRQIALSPNLEEGEKNALSVVTRYVQQLNPTDGKGFIKEIFGEHDTKNANWRQDAENYIERQMLNVSKLTGVRWGSAEQNALLAQAQMAFDKAIKDAAADDKPLEGAELLIKAHEVMLPFRKQVKPKIGQFEVPEMLRTSIPETIAPPKKGKDKRIEYTPDDRLNDYWDKLSDKQKSDIWNQYEFNPNRIEKILEMIKNAKS